MARSYDAAVAALTLNVPFKWVDNLLSRHTVDGVERVGQGTTRRLSPDAVIRLEIIRILAVELGLPIPRAVQVAAILSSAGDGRASIGSPALELMIDLPLLRRRIAAKLSEAVEISPQRRRGRPPRKPIRVG